MIDRDDILSALAEAAATALPASPRLEPDASLADAGLDSVAMVELLAAVEARFAMSIPPEEIVPENFVSLRSLADLVARLQA